MAKPGRPIAWRDGFIASHVSKARRRRDRNGTDTPPRNPDDERIQYVHRERLKGETPARPEGVNDGNDRDAVMRAIHAEMLRRELA